MKYNIEYGWCYTDHKKGRDIRPFYRDVDYVFGEKYSSEAQKLIGELMLPIPNLEEVYRGTYNDMLLADSHAFTVRIGNIDIEKLINPFFLQPIGWIQSDNVTVALYPGVERSEQVYKTPDSFCKAGEEFKAKMAKADTEHKDKFFYNTGVIQVQSKKKLEDVVVVIDTDNSAIGLSKEIEEKKSEVWKRNCSIFNNKADALAATIYEVYGDKKCVQSNIRAFEKHQSLRRRFFDACDGSSVLNKAKLGKLYDTCYEMVDNPKSFTCPTWKKEGNLHKPADIIVNNTKLYNSWTVTPKRTPAHLYR